MKNIFLLILLLSVFGEKSARASDINQHDLNVIQRNLCNRINHSTIKDSFSSVVSDVKYHKYYNHEFKALADRMAVDLFILVDSYKIIENSLSNVCHESYYLHDYFEEAYLNDANEYCSLRNYLPSFAVEYMDETGFFYIAKRDLRRLNNRKMLNQN